MSSSSLVEYTYFQICNLVLEICAMKSSNSICVTIVVVKGGHFWFCISCLLIFYGSPFEKFEDLGLQVCVMGVVGSASGRHHKSESFPMECCTPPPPPCLPPPPPCSPLFCQSSGNSIQAALECCTPHIMP